MAAQVPRSELLQAPTPGATAGVARGTDASWITPRRFALFLGLLVCASFPEVLLGRATFVFRDYGLFSYPVAAFQRECFWNGEFPLWNPYSFCGLPFLAQWNTLALYPPALFYLLLPLTWSLPVFCLLHLYWGGLGMYFVAHRWTQHRLAAALGGILFAFNGLTLNFLMWPSHIATFAWAPWLIWLAAEGWREGGTKLLWAVAAGAMQMLAGGPETIFLTWALLLLLAAGDWLREPALRVKIPLRFAGMAGLVTVLCAAQLLPFLELLARSQRDSGYGSAAWSMPPWGWANFVAPLFRTVPTTQGIFFQPEQGWTSSYYIGAGAVLLLVVAATQAREWRTRLLLALVCLSLVLALGDTGLVYRALRGWVPGMGVVRYPVKFVILILMLAPLLAAGGFASLARRGARPGRLAASTAICLLVAILLIGLLGESSPMVRQNALSRAAFLVVIFGLGYGLLRFQDRRQILFGVLLLLVFWLDLSTHVPTQNPSAPPDIYAPNWMRAQTTWDPAPALGETRALLAPDAQEALKYRTLRRVDENYLLNRMGLLGNCNLLDRVPQAHGFFSLTPAEINNAIAILSIETNRSFTGLLDFMGVAQINSATNPFAWQRRPGAMPLVTIGQQPVFVSDREAFEALSQTNVDFRQLVLLPSEAGDKISARCDATAKVVESRFTRNRVVIQTQADATSMVAIAQTSYPAWRAFVDGKPAKVWRANYAFQALEVPAGHHTVLLAYSDHAFYRGSLLSGVGAVICGWLCFRFRNRRSPCPKPSPEQDVSR